MGLSMWIETMGSYAETFICPRCRNKTMRKRNGFSSCSVCGKKIMNLKEVKNAETIQPTKRGK